MSYGFSLDTSQLKSLIESLKDLPQRLESIIDAEVQDGAKAIAAEAKQRAPGDFGFLRNEIGSEKTGSMQANVFSGTLYSPYVEFGTRTKVSIPPGLESYAAQFKGSPPGVSSLSAKEAIFAWCKRKGIDEKSWYPIYISIMVNGIKPQPFFFPAVNRITPIIINRIKKVLAEDAFSSKILFIRDSIV